jgi:protein O-mannosyl-transferase
MVEKKGRVRQTNPGSSAVTKSPAYGSSAFLPALVLGIVSIAVYANTFTHDYAYDDMSVIKGNSIVIRGITAIPEILTTPYRHGFFTTSNDLYRPLSLVMFAIEYQVFDGSPAAGHVINVIFFAGCVVLLFLFFNTLFERKKPAAAFIAALLFAVHPVHTEVVANIKSRDELLCFFFALSSLIIFMNYVRSGKARQLFSGALLLFLSLLSKETAITFLVIIPFTFFFYKNENRKRSLFISLGAIAVTALFMVIRFSVLHNYHTTDSFDVGFMDNPLAHSPSVGIRLATAIWVLAKYLELLFFPYPLVCDYSYNAIPFVNFGNIVVWLSLFAYLLLAATAIYRLLKIPRDPFAFGILFFLFTISLFSNLFFVVGAEMAERFIFFPSAGFCLLIGLAAQRLLAGASSEGITSAFSNKKLLGVVIPVLILLSCMTWIRNMDWVNSLTLYRADIKHAPNNARLHFFLGNELLITQSAGEVSPEEKKQMVDEAIGHLQLALAIYPGYSDAQRALGNGYFFMSRLDSAEYHFNRALAIKPGDLEALNNLDVAYFNDQKFQQSIETCRKILELKPENTEKYNNIGICYIHLEQYDSAITTLKTGALLDPEFNSFYQNIALAYKLTNQIDSAKKYESIARRQAPGFTVF